MKCVTLRVEWTAVFALSLTLGLSRAAAPVIGTVTSGGAFRLNGDTVMANGTLTEGAVLESGRGDSSLRMAGGARLYLVADSRGKVYRDRMILEKGEASLETAAGFHLVARGLTIRPDRGLTTGGIGLLGNTRVRVAAVTGSFRVLNARGVLVANVAAGSALELDPQASAAATHITGTLVEHSGHFLLTDRVTGVTVEVTGQGLAAYVGQAVGVTGALNVAAPAAASASQVVAATQVQTIADVAVGPAREASAAAIPVNTVAVVGGVAAVATGGGQPPITPPGKPPGRPPGPRPITPPGRPPGRPPELSR